jgi:glycosyltransferase involved in cell wall biosynthesis
MRILCASQDVGNCPSFRARVLPFINLFAKQGIEVITTNIFNVKNTDGYDLLWLRRTIIPKSFMFTMPMIYDFDDAEYISTDANMTNINYLQFKRIVSKALIVVAGSNNLADVARKINRNVRIIRTGININDYTVSSYSKPPIIVWTGSKPTLPHLISMSKQLEYVCNKYNAKLRIICDVFPNMEAEKIIWTPENQCKYLSDATIGISPLNDTAYARGKCAYKIIQYMASGLPVVASNVGGNLDIFNYGCNGLCVDNKDFGDALDQIFNNDIAEMGSNNRIIAESHFDVNVLFAELLKVMLDAKAMR